jgi:hypothetical protein
LLANMAWYKDLKTVYFAYIAKMVKVN